MGMLPSWRGFYKFLSLLEFSAEDNFLQNHDGSAQKWKPPNNFISFLLFPLPFFTQKNEKGKQNTDRSRILLNSGWFLLFKRINMNNYRLLPIYVCLIRILCNKIWKMWKNYTKLDRTAWTPHARSWIL